MLRPAPIASLVTVLALTAEVPPVTPPLKARVLDR